MKKRLLLLLLLLLFTGRAAGETVVTSFYPIWLFTLNLTEGLENVTVKNLAAPDTGCLHDYQLQTADMKALSEADVFLVNGAGMESFLPMIASAFPDLPVVEASAGIPLLRDTGALEIGEAEAEEEGVNAHIWLDPTLAARMVANLAEGLQQALPDRAEAIAANRDALLLRLQQLDETLRAGLADLPRRDIVTFHEAFPYFARAYDLRVVAVVNREPGETLTPAQMSELAEAVQQLGNPPLFIEPQYEDLSARIIATETGAAVYELDPVVTGPGEDVPPDYYETVMLKNMTVLQEALGG